MCAAILAGLGPCLKNRGNLNNNIGLPLTLLERDAVHRTLVVEIGMNHRGEIAPLAAIAQPTVGVITNVGTAHIEYLGSREAIAREKGDLVAALAPTATAVLNADDPRALAQQGAHARASLRFGVSRAADVRAEHVTALGERGFAFDLVAAGERTGRAGGGPRRLHGAERARRGRGGARRRRAARRTWPRASRATGPSAAAWSGSRCRATSS